jgi:hypothetical protein
MEVCSAFRVPNGSPLFATEIWIFTITFIFIPNCVSNSTSVGIRLIAESTIITELAGTVLPADGADTIEASLAKWVAKSSILLFTFSAGGDNFTNTSTVGILPARRASNVQGYRQKQQNSSRYFHYFIFKYY